MQTTTQWHSTVVFLKYRRRLPGVKSDARCHNFRGFYPGPPAPRIKACQWDESVSWKYVVNSYLEGEEKLNPCKCVDWLSKKRDWDIGVRLKCHITFALSSKSLYEISQQVLKENLGREEELRRGRGMLNKEARHELYSCQRIARKVKPMRKDWKNGTIWDQRTALLKWGLKE
jgi:hypothetical protein